MNTVATLSLTQEFHGHKWENCDAGKQKDDDVEDVWQSVANVPHRPPDLPRLGEVDDEERPQRPGPSDRPGGVDGRRLDDSGVGDDVDEGEGEDGGARDVLGVPPEALEPGEAHLVAEPEYEECDASKLQGDGGPVGQGQPWHRRPLEQGQGHQHQVAEVDHEHEPSLLVEPVQLDMILGRNEVWNQYSSLSLLRGLIKAVS